MPIKLDCVEFCKALADPTRQKILEMLLEKEKTVSEVVEAFNLTQPTISHHLEILSRNGLLTFRKESKQVYYRTNQDNLVYCCGNLMSKFDLD
ncbi:MAG: metalloregulator ArsR/SmtB family transcription factor [Pelolinea sp.]|nr:metalloregulator ArsR/SmtB family transcription factor [Pelolinea sp.]